MGKKEKFNSSIVCQGEVGSCAMEEFLQHVASNYDRCIKIGCISGAELEEPGERTFHPTGESDDEVWVSSDRRVFDRRTVEDWAKCGVAQKIKRTSQ